MGAKASKFNPLVIMLLGLAGIASVSLSASVPEVLAVIIGFGALARGLGLVERGRQ